MRCSNCRNDNPVNKKFCGDCGALLGNVCPKCGVDNPVEKRFCGDCGAALAAGEATAPTPPPVRSAAEIRVAPEQPDAALALEGERKTVTALFADIKGSTELEQDLDPEEARAIVDPALKLMIDAVRRYDGYIVQSTGDGIFALFGAPVAHEDHPQRALYAALRMQDELTRYSARLREAGTLPIEARVGVNTGEVVVRSIATGQGHTEYTPIGHTTNLASRMQALAPTGSIAISENTRKLVEGYFALKPLGPTKVKGVTEPVNVYEVTGLGPLRTRLQRSAGRGLTKFVGREREMEAMRNAAELARAGRGQIVAAMAEAGTGKSRLFFEFKAKNQSGWMVLETFSVSHGKASAYFPVIDLLHNYFKITGDDDERSRRAKVIGAVLALDRALEDTLPYLFALLGIIEGDDPLAQMDGQIKKRRTLDAIKRILLRESLNQPLIVIFEDLHWIDDETQALLNLLADSIGTAKILLLVNYRPEYSHQWGSKTYYTQLRLDPLGKESAEEMLDALLASPAPAALTAGASRREPALSGAEGSRGDIDGAARVRARDIEALKRLIIEKTEGNPFFMEETVQVLLDEGALMRDGATIKLIKSLDELKIPPTVQAILAARIDRLPAAEKDLLQVLAVIGKEFPLSLMRAVVSTADDDLARMLDDLQLGEFIYEQPAVGDVEYTFKHALTQEVAYGSVLMERRRVLHDRAGEAIEGLYRDHLDDHLAELAHHFARGGNLDKVVKYLALAGKRSLGRYALVEAQAQLGKGLESLRALPESPQRDTSELGLTSDLAEALWRGKGPSAPETRETIERATTVAEKTGNLAHLIMLLGRLQISTRFSGDYPKVAALADQTLRLAEREGSRASLAIAHYGKMSVHYYNGDLQGVEEFFARWRDYQEAVGSESRVAGLAMAGTCAWLLGHIEIARDRIVEAVAFARDTKDPLTLVLGEFFEGNLYRLAREPERADLAVAQALALCEEHEMKLGLNLLAIRGWARAQLGAAGEGIALIRQGLAEKIEIGSKLHSVEALICLAEAQALGGMTQDALIAIERALEENPYEVLVRPEAMTIRGELRQKVGQSKPAEADFREAIALAQRMGAKMLELRATTSLARLLDRQGKRDEARAMLAAIYNWFTEGFDTADLKDAKSLLDEFGA
ncbi:MAG: adenylate/guanylate cyclase domain-containing protein [Candidatus Binataceae bacterium]